MYYLIFGEDTYRLRQKIDEIKKKFGSGSMGDTNTLNLDGGVTDFNTIEKNISAMPFLSDRRLVIIKNLLAVKKSEVQEKVAKLLDNIPKTTVLVFWEEGIPDRRLKLFKKLKKFFFADRWLFFYSGGIN